MFAAPLLALTLLAQSQAAPSPEPVRLAAPGFSTVNVDERMGEFASEHLAQQLTERGMRVITQSEIATLIGLERQRQLLACDDDSSCLVELGGALGVEGVLTGSIGRFGSAFQVNVKVLSARDASPMALFSRRANTEEALLEALSEGAVFLVKEVHLHLGRAVPEAPPRALTPTGARTAPARSNVLTFAPLGLALGFYGLEYERVLTPAFSLSLTPQLIVMDWDFTAVFGAEIILGGRYYVSGTAPTGLFLAGELRLGTGTFDVYDTSGFTRQLESRFQGPTLAPAAVVGYSLLLTDWLHLSGGIGLGYGLSGYMVGLLPLFRLSTGVAF